MKKIIFNRENVPNRGGHQTTGCWIRIHYKGRISFSKDVVEMVGIANSGFILFKDAERPTDWYIEKSDDENAFRLRKKLANKWDQTFVMQSKALAGELLAACGDREQRSVKCMVAKQPTDGAYAILTKSATSKTKAA